jgi:hypothetical protein
MPSETVDGRHEGDFGMTDLFGGAPLPKAKVGTGNGTLLGHIANGMSRAELQRNHREGRYPDAHPEYLKLIGVQP